MEVMGSFKKDFKKGGKSTKNGGNQPGGMGGDNFINSVIYVQHTRGSSLAKALREEEEAMDKITGYKYKYLKEQETPWRVCSTDPIHGLEQTVPGRIVYSVRQNRATPNMKTRAAEKGM